MKKYIRTKVGIYQVRKPALDEYLWEDSTYVYGHGHIDNKDIIKRADTIEELCDAVVRIKNNRLPLCFNMPTEATYKWVNNYLKTIMEDKDIIEIYGAIWTDKGLIYVAKLNDKGELELL